MPKSARVALADALEDLKRTDYDKFCHRLLDRGGEPRVRRVKVEGKSFLDVADVLVSTFTDSAAVDVAAEILTQIGCNQEAQALLRDVQN